MALSCTFDTNLKGYPCTPCLDHKEKLAVMVLLMSSMCNRGTPSDAHTIADLSVCNACYNEEEILGIILNILADYAIEAGYIRYTTGELRALAACLYCYDEHMLWAMLATLFCCHLQNVLPLQ